MARRRPSGWLRDGQEAIKKIDRANATYVGTDSLGDLEVGCVVWSKTVQHGDGFAGGPVLDVVVTDDGSFEFVVLRWRGGRDPYRHVFDGDDINLEATTFYGQHARDAAKGIHDYLADKKRSGNLGNHERHAWTATALALEGAGLTGQWTPRANTRYRARFDNKQAAS